MPKRMHCGGDAALMRALRSDLAAGRVHEDPIQAFPAHVCITLKGYKGQRRHRFDDTIPFIAVPSLPALCATEAVMVRKHYRGSHIFILVTALESAGVAVKLANSFRGRFTGRSSIYANPLPYNPRRNRKGGIYSRGFTSLADPGELAELGLLEIV